MMRSTILLVLLLVLGLIFATEACTGDGEGPPPTTTLTPTHALTPTPTAVTTPEPTPTAIPTESPSPTPAWSIKQNGEIVEIAYGSGSHFPQYAALHLDSGFLRMNYGPESGWGTSILVLPSFWEGGVLYQGAKISITWETLDSDLVLSLTGRVSNVVASIEISLSPPTDNSISATVAVEVDGDVNLDDRPGEAFKLVTLASMHVSPGEWDTQAAFAGSSSISIPSSGWIFDTPVTHNVFGLNGGTSQWKVNAPTIEVSLDRSVTITGWVTPSDDPNSDNVGFWGASETPVRSWQYTIVARP